MLQEASKSGKLDEALELLRQEKEEVVQAAPEAGPVCGGDAWDGAGGWMWGWAIYTYHWNRKPSDSPVD